MDTFPPIPPALAQSLVRLSMAEADVAIREGNVPIGGLIASVSGEVLVQGHNTQNTDFDPTAHAELNMLRALGRQLQTRYLPEGLILVSNAETCSMCASAAIKAHVYRFVYGAPAEDSMDPWLPLAELALRAKKPLQIIGGVLAQECMDQIAQGRAALTP